MTLHLVFMRYLESSPIYYYIVDTLYGSKGIF